MVLETNKSNKHLNENISNPNQPNDYFVEFYPSNS